MSKKAIKENKIQSLFFDEKTEKDNDSFKNDKPLIKWIDPLNADKCVKLGEPNTITFDNSKEDPEYLKTIKGMFSGKTVMKMSASEFNKQFTKGWND